MSYRQCRNLCEMLRSLNYPRIISLENFVKPNFELVADILYWLSQRYDPQAEISDNINEQKDRIQFMRSVVTLFATKARIKLNPKKLYQADSEAVQEILKITSILYKALSSKAIDQQEAASFSLPTKVSNLKGHKILSNEISDLGAKLYDAISKETDLKIVRNKALSFLEGMSGVNDGNDQAYIENCVLQIMKQQEESTNEMIKYVGNMEREQKNLEEKIKKKAGQVERAQKRYRSLITVKPSFMEEFQRLEMELERLYQVYVDKYRNLDYLENELERYNKIQDEKLRKAKKELQKMQKKVRDQQIKDFRADQELNDGLLDPEAPEDQRGLTRGNSRRVDRQNINQGHPNQVGQESQRDEGEEEDQESGEDLQDEDDDSDF